MIRFAFAPDPVWNYIVDSGILEEKGTEAGIDINAFQSFDEFGLFAGGNADVLSTGSYETPLLDEQGIETVTFGKYNANKDIFAVAADEAAKTAADLDEGCKVAAESTTGNTVIWARWSTRSTGGRSRRAATTSSSSPPTTRSCRSCSRTARSAPRSSTRSRRTEALRTDQIKALYDGKSASQLYAEEIADDPNHLGVDSNNFVARKEWFDENPEVVAFFLDVWQEGMDEWIKNSDQIIADYPEDFAVQSPEDEKFMQDYVKNAFDFQQKSVYLTPEWVRTRKASST